MAPVVLSQGFHTKFWSQDTHSKFHISLKDTWKTSMQSVVRLIGWLRFSFLLYFSFYMTCCELFTGSVIDTWILAVSRNL